jgi:hypothetical protein
LLEQQVNNVMLGRWQTGVDTRRRGKPRRAIDANLPPSMHRRNGMLRSGKVLGFYGITHP